MRQFLYIRQFRTVIVEKKNYNGDNCYLHVLTSIVPIWTNFDNGLNKEVINAGICEIKHNLHPRQIMFHRPTLVQYTEFLIREIKISLQNFLELENWDEGLNVQSVQTAYKSFLSIINTALDAMRLRKK